MEPEVEAAVTALANEDNSPAIPAAPAATVPLREDQVQNAVAFLSHPKVRGSTTASKRAFLDGKGLTAAEIEEGFRRVPSVAAAVPDATPSTSSPPPKPFATATTDALQGITPAQYHAVQPIPPQPEPIRWTQVVAGAGAVAAGIWVVHHFVVPPVRRWWQGKYEPSPGEAAAAAVAAAIQAQTSEMRATLDSMKAMLAELKEQRTSNGGAVGLADLRSELRSLALSLEAGGRSTAATNATNDMRREVSELKTLLTASTLANGRRGATPLPSDIPSFARASPTANGHANGNGYSHDVTSTPRPASPTPSATPSQPSHPASYMEVLEMLERGETPPGIRDDINDSAPDPHQAASEARMRPRSKPWERSQASAGTAGLLGPPSTASSTDGKSVHITEIEPTAAGTSHAEGKGQDAAWKPPAVPQRSLFGQPASSSAPSDHPNGSN